MQQVAVCRQVMREAVKSVGYDSEDKATGAFTAI